MGNSEVGHLTIGSGRILFQDLVRVNKAIEDGSFFENPVLRGAFERGKNVHLLGLVSHGGVHSHIDHLQGAARVRAGEDVDPRVHRRPRRRRRTPPIHDLAELPADRIATVAGRYYAMDRDNRWDRTQKALEAVTNPGDQPPRGATRSRKCNETTTRVSRTSSSSRSSSTGGRGSTPRPTRAIFFNFRPDRGRASSREKLGELGVDLTTMTRYRDDFAFPVAFPEHVVEGTLAEVLSEHGIRQLHAAETEKYAHVTYFLDGGREQPFDGEERILVDSPRDVASYDHKPQMSAVEVADKVVAAIDEGGLGFVVVNFANPDMVGHTGVIPAVVRGGRDDRRVPRPRRRGGRAGRRRVPDHRRPRERREAPPRRRSQPAHGAHDEPRARRFSPPRASRSATASCPRSRRRFSPFSGCRNLHKLTQIVYWKSP